MKKPTILVSSAHTSVEYYIHALEAVGAHAIGGYLPQWEGEIDGLLLCGGRDVAPKFYGAEVNGAMEPDLDRDEHEFKLLDICMEKGKPVLGICRGHQVLNVYFGGTLIQHLDTAERHSNPKHFLTHGVVTEKGCALYDIYGEKFRVNSSHHEAVLTPGRGLRVVQHAEEDGVAEAIQHESLPVYGVQWHPERMMLEYRREDAVDSTPFMRYFVERCIPKD